MRSTNGNPSLVTDLERQLRSRYPVKQLSSDDLGSTNVLSTSSFRYDALGTGLKSTQEIPLDWSRFENHTFFHSAKSKVDEAFYKIINEYPFDGSRRDIEAFEDSLTGFESYIKDRFPKNKGFLSLSGSSGGAGGSYIAIENRSGYLFENSKDSAADPALDSIDGLLTLQTHLFVPGQANNNSIIFQRQGSGCGYTLFLSRSTSVSMADVHFLVTSGSRTLHVSGSIPKDGFVHVAASISSSESESSAAIFFNGLKSSEQTRVTNFQPISLGSAQLFIGSGSTHNGSGYLFSPVSTLSGCLDDVRLYTSLRSESDILNDYQSPARQDGSLKLYFKFNEPTGSFAGNNIVLDSSGYSFHSEIENYTTTARGLQYPLNPMLEEDVNDCIVLFSNYPDTQLIHNALLEEAIAYDDENPNLITRLVPAQYLSSGADAEGFGTSNQNMGQDLNLDSLRGGQSQKQPQTMISLLLVYAKMFDEIKIFIDHVSNLMNFEYQSSENISDKMIPFIAKALKIQLPDLFSTPSVGRLVKGGAVSDQYFAADSLPLKKLRAQIWRRILNEHHHLLASKGTHRSIRSAFSAMGIDPESFFHIREFGGNKGRTILDLRQKRNKVSYFADFSGSFNPSVGTVDGQGFSSTVPHAVGGFLSGSRVEPGHPFARGAFVNSGGTTLSNNSSDGLWTSGSFSIETRVRFPKNIAHDVSQSIARLSVTGSSLPSSKHGVLLNLMAFSNPPSFELHARPFKDSSAEIKRLRIDANPFDGGIWSVSFGRAAGFSIGTSLDELFLRVSRQNAGSLTFTSASSLALIPSSSDVLQNVSSQYNASGAFLVVGSQSLGSGNLFLNGDSKSSHTNFTGQISNIRFWSKYITLSEWVDHTKDFESLGVNDPRKNFFFESKITGSFERLRQDISLSQASLTSSNAGSLTGFDFSQSGKHLALSGFEPNKKILKTVAETVLSLSPFFDLLENDQKARVRSLSNPQPDEVLASTSPVYQLPEDEEVLDDNRLSIEYSFASNLNRDILRATSNLDFFDDALGRPTVYFDSSYSDLDDFSKVYFKRLTSDIDLDRFSRLYRWLDGSLEVLISQLVPAKTRFYGINQVIEPHSLERSRHRFFFDDLYLNEVDRFRASTIKLTSFSARFRRS